VSLARLRRFDRFQFIAYFSQRQDVGFLWCRLAPVKRGPLVSSLPEVTSARVAARITIVLRCTFGAFTAGTCSHGKGEERKEKERITR